MPVAQRGSTVTKGFGVPYPIASPSGVVAGDCLVWLLINYSGTSRSHADFDTRAAETFNGATIHVLTEEVVTPAANYTPVNANSNDECILLAFSGVNYAGITADTDTSVDVGAGTVDLNPVDGIANSKLLLLGNTNILYTTGGTLLGSNSDLRVSSKDLSVTGSTGNISVDVNDFAQNIAVKLLLPEFVEDPSVGYRLTMAGDRVLTMAGDSVLLMGGEPVVGGSTGGIKFNGVSKPIKFGVGWSTKKLKRHNGTSWVETIA